MVLDDIMMVRQLEEVIEYMKLQIEKHITEELITEIAIAEEREACALILDKLNLYDNDTPEDVLDECAEAIRARGEE